MIKNTTHLKWVMSLRYAAISAAMVFTSAPVEANLIDPQNAEELSRWLAQIHSAVSYTHLTLPTKRIV